MKIDSIKIALLIINITLGSLVLFSYAHGLMTNPKQSGALWGSVPESILPFYTVSMISAALGYLVFTSFILVALDPAKTIIAHRFPYELFLVLYVLILLPSALWMPLTFATIKNPSLLTWVLIRVVLFTVGIASVLLLISIIKVQPNEPKWAYRLAIAGAVAFCNQTMILDALVWPVYFRV